MTNRQKRNAWKYLRKFKPIIKRVVDGQLSLQSLIVFSRLLQIRIKLGIYFKKMKEEAQTRKQTRQAYRFAIAAGIYKVKPGQYQQNWHKLNTGYTRIRRVHDESKNAHLGAG